MDASEHREGDTSEGWVTSKRGRGSSTDGDPVPNSEGMDLPMAGHTSINLNLSPPYVVTPESPHGRGTKTASSGRGPGSKGGGRAQGRGRGRGEKLPLLSPRYISTASNSPIKRTFPVEVI
jgi:hypothetical protein